MSKLFPFSAIVGQEEMKTALLIAAVDPRIGGVMVFGDRGTGKSTAVRALASLLPPIRVVAGSRFNADPDARDAYGADPLAADGDAADAPVPFVDLPLGASKDRVVGALDLEAALTQGIKRFESGLLARAKPRVPVHRRDQPARGSHRRPAARRRGVGRKPRRTRGAVRPPPGARGARGQRQPRGGRAAPPAARPLWTVGRGAHARRPCRAHHRGQAA